MRERSARRTMISGIGSLVVAAVFGFSISVKAQETWCVFENVVSHNPIGDHVITRSNWLRVARCGAAATLAPNWQRAPGNPVSSQMTWAEAMALRDAMMLSFGSPGPNDRFHQYCDRWHELLKRQGSNPPQYRFRHYNGGDALMPLPWVIDRSGQCCEDFAMIVFGASLGSDCRSVDLGSVRARVTRTPRGWSSNSGAQVTVRALGRAPIIVPGQSATPAEVGGRYTLRVTGACSPGLPRNHIFVRRSGQQVTFISGGDRASTDGGRTWHQITPIQQNTAILGPNMTFSFRYKTARYAGKFSGNSLEIQVTTDQGCVSRATGAKAQ